MKLLGIDYGLKRVGIALTDDSGAVAFPKETVLNDNNLLKYVCALVERERIVEVVMGHSVNLQGEDNSVMEHIERFKEALETQAQVPVHFESETFTSVEARRLPGGAKEGQTKGSVDDKAAAIILQAFIDKQS